MENSFMRIAVALLWKPNSLLLTQKYYSYKDEPCSEGADSLGKYGGQVRKNKHFSAIHGEGPVFFKLYILHRLILL